MAWLESRRNELLYSVLLLPRVPLWTTETIGSIGGRLSRAETAESVDLGLHMTQAVLRSLVFHHHHLRTCDVCFFTTTTYSSHITRASVAKASNRSKSLLVVSAKVLDADATLCFDGNPTLDAHTENDSGEVPLTSMMTRYQ